MDSIIISAGTTITLPQNTYTKDGYTFVGWNTVANPTEDNPGISYTDQSDFTASSTGIENITLYAIWTKTISNLTYMQDFKTLSEKDKTTVLKSMVEDEQYQLKDSRDQKQYYISKLKDGNVWMTQNLDLDLNSQVTLTPENTNISANWTPTNSTVVSVYEWQNKVNEPYSLDPGDVYYYTSGTDENDIEYNSLAECEAVHDDGTCRHYHTGNYYNWPAAVASNNTSNMTTPHENAPDSVCPAGWKLPTGWQGGADKVADSDFGVLMHNYDVLGGENCAGACYNYAQDGFRVIRTAPLWFGRFGSVYSYYIDYEGAEGVYWSSTVINGDSARYLKFDKSFAYLTGGYKRVYGTPIRCLAE